MGSGTAVLRSRWSRRSAAVLTRARAADGWWMTPAGFRRIASRAVATRRRILARRITSLGPVRARGRSIIAKPQNHPAVPGKGDALTIMLDETKRLEFT